MPAERDASAGRLEESRARASELHELVWRVALRQTGATQTQPFGPEYEVFKVCGKVFAMTTRVRDVDVATLKCEPEVGEALRQEHDSITCGYHMNKRHWISLASSPDVTPELVEELVESSYLLVVEGLTTGQRASLALRT